MLSYSIVIISPKRLENRLHTDQKTEPHEDKQMDTKTKKISEKNNTVCCQCWSPRYRVSALSTKCGGCDPKELIVASSHKIKQIIIITILTLICQSQFSFLLNKKKIH